MTRMYGNIWKGKERQLTAVDYDKSLLTSEDFENDILAGRNYISVYKKERINNIAIYTVEYKDFPKPICILWGPMKNSGTDSPHKRVQVSSNVPELAKETPYIAIGGYNTGDTHLYVAMMNGVREFIIHAQEGASYSSLWFDYPSLWAVYKKGVHTWFDNKQRKDIGFTLPHVEYIHKLIKSVLGGTNAAQAIVSGPETNDEIPYKDFTKEIIKYKDNDILPRDPEYRMMALKREKYSCELCGTKNTFADRNNDEYFEGHHLIMYNPTVQRRFKLCLDHPNNIICLCPNCHRKIHNSPDSETMNMLIKLFSKHNGLLKTYAIKDLKEILNDYKIL